MNTKHYVSLKAARLLKEKGYNLPCVAYYQNDEFRPYSLTRSGLSIYNKNAVPDYMNQYSAPTKAEAIDWLESKGVIVEFQYYQESSTWSYAIYCICYMSSDEEFQTRWEAEDAAIIKALELLCQT
jgi:hypothetical protein